MMAGRRKRAHSVGDQPKLKLQRSVMSPMVGNEEISKNKDKNHDSSVITQQELLTQSQQRVIDHPFSSQLSDVVVDVSDTIPDVADLNAVYIEFHKLVKTVFELKETVRKQQVCINELYSFANKCDLPQSTCQNVTDLQGSQTTQSSQSHSLSIPSSTASTYSAAVAASNHVLQTSSTKTTLNESVRRAVLTAVHTEMQTKQARERNIVITGLRRSNTTQDRDLVSKLVFEEFGMDLRIVQCKRLGKSPTTNEGRPQPLRVVFESASIARDVIDSAKYLRRSTDEYVRGNVFINADLTRAEAEAAYHARCERRRLQQLKSKSTSATTESRAQHQQQSVSLATSSAACVLSTNSRDVNASVEEHPIVGVSSSSSRCITVSADVHRPMSASQVLSDSVPNVVQPGGMQPGPFLVHPPSVFMQQGLTAGSVSFSPALPVYSNPQITAPPLFIPSAPFSAFQSSSANPNVIVDPTMQPVCQSGLTSSRA